MEEKLIEEICHITRLKIQRSLCLFVTKCGDDIFAVFQMLEANVSGDVFVVLMNHPAAENRPPDHNTDKPCPQQYTAPLRSYNRLIGDSFYFCVKFQQLKHFAPPRLNCF